MSLTQTDVKKVARLSRIKLSDDDVIHFQNQINGIVSWIDDLQNVDVSAIHEDLESSPSMYERPDHVTAPNRHHDVLLNAPQQQHGMYVVPKVVE
jgi:aspartyl-tRNA(Asn)/glutamyl-tRNA(Gln) amidotransferase subunit C